MSRTSPITNSDIRETRATCLWDLDQFIGEEGWDDEELEVTFKSGKTFLAKGRRLKKELEANGYGDIDPRRAISIIKKK